MNHQVLVASMHQLDYSLVEKMNIQSDAIVGNQCDVCSDEDVPDCKYRITYLNRTDRGGGKNRNEALLRATGDILTFADEDMVFCYGYPEIIQNAFREVKDADAIIFNIETVGGGGERRVNNKIGRLKWYNSFNYGTARLSVRANSIRRENIFFHTFFGGGTTYSSGEDTLFISDMLKRGLPVYVYPAYIATVNQENSSWFFGYTPKYLYDKGALFAAVSNRMAGLLCLQGLIRHSYLWKDNN